MASNLPYPYAAKYPRVEPLKVTDGQGADREMRASSQPAVVLLFLVLIRFQFVMRLDQRDNMPFQMAKY